MAVDGKTLMAKALMKKMGLDPDAYSAMISEFLDGMKQAVAQINANQQRIETKLDHITQVMSGITVLMTPPGTSTPIYENGKHTGVMFTDERFPPGVLTQVDEAPKET